MHLAGNRKGRHALGAHAGRVRVLPFAWRPVLCVALAMVLAVYPLPAAYGADAPEAVQPAVLEDREGASVASDDSGSERAMPSDGDAALVAEPVLESGESEGESSETPDGEAAPDALGPIEPAVGSDDETPPADGDEDTSSPAEGAMPATPTAAGDAQVPAEGEAASPGEQDADNGQEGQGAQLEAAVAEPVANPVESAPENSAATVDDADDPSDAGVGSSEPASLEESKASASKPAKTAASQTGSAAATGGAAAAQGASEVGDTASDSVPLASAGSASFKPALDPVTGTIPLLVVVVGFLGSEGLGVMPYDDAYDWAQTVFGSESGISAYYRDMSNGVFTFSPALESSVYGVDGNTNKADKANDGVVHVKLSEAHGNWSDDYYADNAVAGAMLGMFSRALQATDSLVNYARYDADGDGKLSGRELSLAFVVAGYEAANLSSEPDGMPTLWSHAWSYTDAGVAAPKLDEVEPDAYIAIAEKLIETEDDDAIRQEPLAVLMHELGHNLGLPDLYDTASETGEWSASEVDLASLMATGNWATITDGKGVTRYVPTALDAWSRYQLGWVKPTIVKKSGVYTVTAQSSKKGYSVLLVPTANKGEYYLIENRTFSGHDVGFSEDFSDYPNGGIVIWHVDNGVVAKYLGPNKVNGSDHRPGAMPLYPVFGSDGWDYALNFRSADADISLLFWTKSMWRDAFSSKALLNLPLYATGKKADDPKAVTLSGIRIQFLTDAGGEMRIRIFMPGDGPEDPAETEDPTDTEDPEEPVDPEDPEKPAPNDKPEKQDVRPASYEVPAAVADAAATEPERMPATGDELPAGTLLVLCASAALAVFARSRRDAIGR